VPVHTTVSVRKKVRVGAAARSPSSAWAAARAKRTLQHLPPLRPRRASPNGTGLTVPNTNTTFIAEIPHKNALRPSNVRAAASTLRRRGKSPCGRVVRTPPRARGQVPRDALRHRGVDSPAILNGRARGFHEDLFVCSFLVLREFSFCFRGFQAHLLIRIINSLFPSVDPALVYRIL
jgi:hypothetical protein